MSIEEITRIIKIVRDLNDKIEEKVEDVSEIFIFNVLTNGDDIKVDFAGFNLWNFWGGFDSDSVWDSAGDEFDLDLLSDFLCEKRDEIIENLEKYKGIGLQEIK